MTDRIVLAIPSRYGASRLPGKPLLMVAGKPLIARVIECGQRYQDAELVVATDDARIAAVAADYSVTAVLTRPDHATGSDRLAEVAQLMGWDDRTIVVNLQGDEPLMPLSCLQEVVAALQSDSGADAATLATPVASASEAFDPSCVKVVCDQSGRALYFSRAPIPWARDDWAIDRAALSTHQMLRHLGLYAYRAHTLRAFAALTRSPLERAESLEQLRLLEHGMRIAVRLAPAAIPPGVDTQEDLDRVSELLAAGGL